MDEGSPSSESSSLGNLFQTNMEIDSPTHDHSSDPAPNPNVQVDTSEPMTIPEAEDKEGQGVQAEEMEVDQSPTRTRRSTGTASKKERGPLGDSMRSGSSKSSSSDLTISPHNLSSDSRVSSPYERPSVFLFALPRRPPKRRHSAKSYSWETKMARRDDMTMKEDTPIKKGSGPIGFSLDDEPKAPEDGAAVPLAIDEDRFLTSLAKCCFLPLPEPDDVVTTAFERLAKTAKFSSAPAPKRFLGDDSPPEEAKKAGANEIVKKQAEIKMDDCSEKKEKEEEDEEAQQRLLKAFGRKYPPLFLSEQQIELERQEAERKFVEKRRRQAATDGYDSDGMPLDEEWFMPSKDKPLPVGFQPLPFGTVSSRAPSNGHHFPKSANEPIYDSDVDSPSPSHLTTSDRLANRPSLRQKKLSHKKRREEKEEDEDDTDTDDSQESDEKPGAFNAGMFQLTRLFVGGQGTRPPVNDEEVMEEQKEDEPNDQARRDDMTIREATPIKKRSGPIGFSLDDEPKATEESKKKRTLTAFEQKYFEDATRAALVRLSRRGVIPKTEYRERRRSSSSE